MSLHNREHPLIGQDHLRDLKRFIGCFFKIQNSCIESCGGVKQKFLKFRLLTLLNKRMSRKLVVLFRHWILTFSNLAFCSEIESHMAERRRPPAALRLWVASSLPQLLCISSLHVILFNPSTILKIGSTYHWVSTWQKTEYVAILFVIALPQSSITSLFQIPSTWATPTKSSS